MRQMRYVTLAAIFMMGCNGETGQGSANDYLPLAVGNKWTYVSEQSGDPGMTWEVVGNTVLDGVDFFVE